MESSFKASPPMLCEKYPMRAGGSGSCCNPGRRRCWLRPWWSNGGDKGSISVCILRVEPTEFFLKVQCDHRCGEREEARIKGDIQSFWFEQLDIFSFIFLVRLPIWVSVLTLLCVFPAHFNLWCSQFLSPGLSSLLVPPPRCCVEQIVLLILARSP